MKLHQTYRYRMLFVNLPLVLMGWVVFTWLGNRFFPLPPQQITITSGPKDGAYRKYAEAYASALALRGVTVQTLESAGSVENLERLSSPGKLADAGFVQGGFALKQSTTTGAVDIQTIAQIDMEPVWLFTRLPDVNSLEQLRGKPVAIGRPGSGSYPITLDLLEQEHLGPQNLAEAPHVSIKTADDLRQAKIDAAMFVIGFDAPLLHAMSQVPGIRLVQLRRTAALSERLPYLEPYLLPAGTLNAQTGFPGEDTILLTAMTNLVVREDLHPAIKRLLAAMAADMHKGAGPMHAAGDFPHLKRVEFPSAAEARHTLAYGLPWLETVLEPRLAYWIYRCLLIGLPVLLLAVFLSRLIFVCMHWLLENRINGWYGELKFIENDLAQPNRPGGLEFARHHRQLSSIEEELKGFRAPQEFNQRLFMLQEHIAFVRNKIQESRGR